MGVTAVRFAMRGGVGHVTLAEPERGNPLDAPFCRDLHRAAEACAAEPSLRAILIEAEGKYFSVGGDLKALTADRAGLAAFVTDPLAALNAALLVFARLDAPVVAAVQGTCAGGGVGLVSSCDFVLAAPEARFVAAFAGIGVSADTGASWYLPRRLGRRRAAEFLILNESWDAATAERHGLVNRVVPAAELAAEARALADRLAAGPTRAFGEIRRLLDRSAGAGLAEQLDAEAAAIGRLVATDDAWNAMTAVLARRAPVFEGR